MKTITEKLIHDLSHLFSTLERNCDLLQSMIDDKVLSLPFAESMINELSNSTIKGYYNLNIFEAVKVIRESRIPSSHNWLWSVDLLRRLTERKLLFFRRYNATICNFSYCDSNDLSLFVNEYYITAIYCILDNALTFAYPGSIICVNFQPDKLVISNVGIPIPENEMTHIYDYEYRGSTAIRHGSISRSEFGLGLGYGLYIAKNVFEAYGSKISITSESIFKKNNEVELLLTSLLDSLHKDKNDSIIWEDFTDIDYDAARDIIEEICKIYDMGCDSNFHLIPDMKRWLYYWDKEFLKCKKMSFQPSIL